MTVAMQPTACFYKDIQKNMSAALVFSFHLTFYSFLNQLSFYFCITESNLSNHFYSIHTPITFSKNRKKYQFSISIKKWFLIFPIFPNLTI
jgi:hypothetical protein